MKTHRLTKVSKTLMFITAAVMLVVGVVLTNGCKKDLQTDKAQQPIVDDASEAVVAHILEFKERMDYYRENPNVKGSEQLLHIDSTILDWEATINLTYCHVYLDLGEMVAFDTVIDIPLVEGDSITIAKASEKYFDNILESIQDKYFMAEFTEKKLVSVDLEPVNGGDSLWISLVVGNPVIPSYPIGDWKYGDDLGQCDGGLYAPLDAAEILAMDVRNHFYQDPPANCRWFFTDIKTYTEDDPTIYPNDDDVPHYHNDKTDNYCDYLIYYAIDNVTPYGTNEVICIENDDEEAFYRQQYIDFTQKCLDNAPVFIEGKMKYYTSVFKGHEYNVDQHYLLKHVLQTKLGRRFLACPAPVPVEDIAQY